MTEVCAHLVHVQLDLERGHHLLQLRVVPRSSVDCLGYEFKYEIEVYLVFLRSIAISAGEIAEPFDISSTQPTLSPLE